MRKKIVAGNWKMNTTPAEGVKLATDIIAKLSEVSKDVTLIVSPPFTHLCCVHDKIEQTPLALSAQNCADEAKGAYTGEVSAAMLKEIGCSFVILGHSERREYYGETNAILSKKLSLAFQNNLTPIFCIGEKLEEREADKHFDVVSNQLQEVVCKLSEADFEKIVIAYEPVWAIGTGKTATSEQAQEMHAYIRKVLSETFGKKAENTPILYGGSCKPSNAQELFSKPDVDGGLIGGASLVADDFIGIAKAF